MRLYLLAAAAAGLLACTTRAPIVSSVRAVDGVLVVERCELVTGPLLSDVRDCKTERVMRLAP